LSNLFRLVTQSVSDFIVSIFTLQLTRRFKSVECAPLLQQAVFSAVEGESGFGGINDAVLDEVEERVHNLSSVLQTGLLGWRSEADL